MKNIKKILFLLLAIIIQSNNTFSQTNDSIFFASYFGFFTKEIIITDLNNCNTVIISKNEGKDRTPVPIYLNNKTESFSITIRNRFFIKNVSAFLTLREINGCYIYIWQKKKNKILFDYRDKPIGNF